MGKQTGSPRRPGKRGKTRYKFAKRGSKVSVSDIMATFEDNDRVQVVVDGSYHAGLPHKSFHGLTGRITGKIGEAYEVSLKKGNQDLVVITTAVHLKKLN